jgi:predicted metal-dependent phosphoesterase TrpH
VQQKCDLHIHTLLSDGIYSPHEIVKKAKGKDLSVISITDHDTIAGVEEATLYGNEIGVQVIPGLEISTDIDDVEVHLLGYFVDIHNEELNKYLSFFREERFNRAKRIIEKLRRLGLLISIEDVMKVSKNSVIGRPHIARTLHSMGLVKSYLDAFNKYIGDNKPAHERKIHISATSAVKLIGDAGGLSFIAHPMNLKESILTALIKAGVDGIEVVHPSHKQHQVKFYRSIVNHYCLLESGGSDFHGGERKDDNNLGRYYVSGSKVELMQQMRVK